MNAPLDESYFQWLYSQIGSVRLKNASKTYWSLARQLYTKEFVWIIPNDDNRLEDGKDLRHEFIQIFEIEDIDSDWMSLGCSMLEMLIAFSRRLEFQDYGSARWCFWEMIENLDLRQYHDRAYNQTVNVADKIDEILDRVIWRNYLSSGLGGLFPLEHPNQDQRRVEIWYQASAYLIEKDYL